MLPRHDGDVDIKHPVSLGGHHTEFTGLQQAVHGLDVLRRHLGQHLQLQVRPSGGKARRGSGLDALQSTGIGHRHGLYVLDDIAADLHPALLRHSAQRRPGLGCRQSDGDGLRAAHSGDQLFLQNFHIAVIMGRLVHSVLLLYPSTTSSSIITKKPIITLTVPAWECSPSCASGISSSTTT